MSDPFSLLFPASVVLQAVVLGGYFWRLPQAWGSQEVRPGWLHFFFETAPLYGLCGPFVSIAALMISEVDRSDWGPWWWWFGVASTIGTLWIGCHDVAQEIQDIRYGVKVRPTRTSWRQDIALLPNTFALLIPTVVVFIVVLKLSQSSALAGLPPALSPEQRPGYTIQFVAPLVSAAVICTWALCLKLWTLGAKPAGVSPMEALGRVSIEVGATIGKLIAFVKGTFWCALGAALICFFWPPIGIFTLVFIIAGVIAVGKGLSEIGPVLKGTPTPDHPSITEMNARTATEDEARRAARGDSGDTFVDSRRYRE